MIPVLASDKEKVWVAAEAADLIVNLNSFGYKKGGDLPLNPAAIKRPLCLILNLPELPGEN